MKLHIPTLTFTTHHNMAVGLTTFIGTTKVADARLQALIRRHDSMYGEKSPHAWTEEHTLIFRYRFTVGTMFGVAAFFTFSIAMTGWIVFGVKRQETVPGEPWPTFSELLATSPLVKNLFCGFLGMCTIERLIFIFFSLQEHLWEEHADHVPAKELARLRGYYSAASAAYVLSVTCLIIGFLLVAVFDVTTAQTEHHVSASVAFVGGIMATFMLFARRCIASKTGNLLYGKLQGKRYVWTAALWLNLLWVLFILAVGIVFVVIGRGWIEMVVMAFILVDTGWQWYDYHLDTMRESVYRGWHEEERQAKGGNLSDVVQSRKVGLNTLIPEY